MHLGAASFLHTELASLSLNQTDYHWIYRSAQEFKPKQVYNGGVIQTICRIEWYFSEVQFCICIICIFSLKDQNQSNNTDSKYCIYY